MAVKVWTAFGPRYVRKYANIRTERAMVILRPQSHTYLSSGGRGARRRFSFSVREIHVTSGVWSAPSAHDEEHGTNPSRVGSKYLESIMPGMRMYVHRWRFGVLSRHPTASIDRPLPERDPSVPRHRHRLGGRGWRNYYIRKQKKCVCGVHRYTPN